MKNRQAMTYAAVLAAAALLVSCGTSKPPATATAPDQQPAAQTGAKPATPAATGQAQPPVAAGTAASKPAAPVNPVNDPNNILSKRSVYYDYDNYDVKPEFRALVEAHARYLRDNPNARVTLEGNCDERGSREYNVALGQKRSEGVKKMMTLLGAREQQIEAVSFGEEKPKSAGTGEAAWSQNRRSDVVYSRMQ